MAHHNSTPKSVLDAPKQTVMPLVVHEGITRQERRHGVPTSMKPVELLIYRRTRNVPFVSDERRRGKKVRRNSASA